MKVPRAISEILPRLSGFALAYRKVIDPPAPINLTVSITNMCNSRCQSCDIWKIYPAEKERLAEELTVEEMEKVFRSINTSVYFFNISGGEPFLRKDIVDIVRVGATLLKPSVVHIPTNALSPQRIAALTEEMLLGLQEWSPGTKLTIKPSFDGVGEFHDWVRGIPGNYKKLVETLGLLAELRRKYDHLRVGVGTVISTMNIDTLPDIIAESARFEVDTYISEVAEERVEMRNVGTGITPTSEQYGEGISIFRNMTFERLREASGLELLTQGMRHYYYEITRLWLRDRKQVIPCYAGISNVHISAYGDVWPCAILSDSKSLGNLKAVNYDFWKIWHSSRADEVRASIRRGECDCPLANQSYANILLSPFALSQVGKTIIKAKLANHMPGAVAPSPERPARQTPGSSPATVAA